MPFGGKTTWWRNPTYLKNMIKSKWVHLRQIGVNITKIRETMLGINPFKKKPSTKQLGKWYEIEKFLWNESKWQEMIWNDMRGCKRIWNDINRTEYLQRTLHQNDRSPFLDVAAANTCNNIWSFLVCLRSGMAKKFKGSFWYVKFHNIL